MNKNIKSPTGISLNCKGWHQEAAFRMIQYNLDKDGGIQYEPGIDYQKLETDSKLLKQIADTTGGKYFHATNKLELSTICDEIDKLEKIDISEERFTIKHEQFYPLVFISIIIYILGIITQLTILRKIP